MIDAALIEFGKRGYDGTTTTVIAQRAGIQQPYIYALFENKRHLFLVCQEVLYERMLAIFEQAVKQEDSPYERLRKMGISYLDLLEDKAWLHCHLRILAASGHSDLREPIRESFERFFSRVSEMSGAGPREVARFLATGITLNAMVSMDAPVEMLNYLRVPREDEL